MKKSSILLCCLLALTALLSRSLQAAHGEGIGNAHLREPSAAWPESKKTLLLTDQPDGTTSLALQMLLHNEIMVMDIRQSIDWDRLESFGAVVTYVAEGKNLSRLRAGAVRAFAEGGGTVVACLGEFAAWNGLRVHIHAQEDAIEVPRLTQEQLKALSDAIKAYHWVEILGQGRDLLSVQGLVGHMPEPWMNEVGTQLRQEILKPIPSIEIKVTEAFTRGFRPGDTVYWCGKQNGQWIQRQLSGGLPEDVEVLAASTVNGEPVMVRQTAGKGIIYALDLLSLDEPMQTWDTRGSFNKYLFPANVLGGGIRYGGTHYNRRPTYEELAGRIKAVAEKYPQWRLCYEGYERGYNTLSLTMGDESKPMWVALGCYHAEDEWLEALGLIDFAAYIAEHADDPAIRTRLERVCLKVIPIQKPTIYMYSLRGGLPGPEQRVPERQEMKDKQYNVVTLWTLHSCDCTIDRIGVNVLTPMGWETMPAIADCHARQVEGRFVRWDPTTGPHQADALSKNHYQPFYRFYAHGCYSHLYHMGTGTMAFCDFIYALEAARAGQRPEQFHQNYFLRMFVWDEPMHKTPVLSDLMVDWTLAAFLESPPEAWFDQRRKAPDYHDEAQIQQILKETQALLPW